MNSWSVVGDGGTCLQSSYRFKVWGKLLAGVCPHCRLGGSRGLFKMDFQIRIGSLLAERLSVWG